MHSTNISSCIFIIIYTSKENIRHSFWNVSDIYCCSRFQNICQYYFWILLLKFAHCLNLCYSYINQISQFSFPNFLKTSQLNSTSIFRFWSCAKHFPHSVQTCGFFTSVRCFCLFKKQFLKGIFHILHTWKGVLLCVL